jgi:hypothetical protein
MVACTQISALAHGISNRLADKYLEGTRENLNFECVFACHFAVNVHQPAVQITYIAWFHRQQSCFGSTGWPAQADGWG